MRFLASMSRGAAMWFGVWMSIAACGAGAQTITTVAGGGGADGNAMLASIHAEAIALDKAGNLYIADRFSSRIRKLTPDGTISTVAGVGVYGATPDGLPAQGAQLKEPKCIVFDDAGNIYFCESGAVRKIGPDGILGTVAGTGTPGLSGDGGRATSAQVTSPSAIAFDSAGNLHFADIGGGRIRKVTRDGIISHVAGGGPYNATLGDGGPAKTAYLNTPSSIAFDAQGNLYVADTNNNRVRRIDTQGVITTVAGNGKQDFAGDGGPAVNAPVSLPSGVAFDAVGNLYISQFWNGRVRKVTPGGIISTIAGTGVRGHAGDGGPALSAELVLPGAMLFDPAGNLLIGDGTYVRKLTTGGMLTTIAGNGWGSYGGDGGAATNAQLLNPTGVAVDSAGNLFVADRRNKRLRKVSRDGVITLIAGNGTNYGSGNQFAVDNIYFEINNVIADGAGNVYVAALMKIEKITPDNRYNIVAGFGSQGFTGDGGPGNRAQISGPAGMALDSMGNLYFADSNNHRIRKVSTDGVITTVAGNGTAGFAGDGGSALAASLNQPFGLAIDDAGNLYVADTFNHRIRRFAPGGSITTIAGTGVAGLAGDGGQALNARFDYPSGVAFDRSGNLYVGDSKNHRVRKIASSGLITTVAGTDKGFAGDGGSATGAKLNVFYGDTYVDHMGIALDADGNLFIADNLNNRVRKVSGAVRTVVEYYNTMLNHYFISSDPAEQAFVDSGGAGPGWVRTGDSFRAFSAVAGPAGTSQVCRFYGSVTPGPNSHFYTASQAECNYLKQLQASAPAGEPKWNYEGIAFASYLPADGQCPADAPVPVYRAYNNRAAQIDSNHRFTTRLAEYQLLVSHGWKAEGVAMCGTR